MSSTSPSFTLPQAQQAQIIRANQRDIFHVSSLRDQTESVLRSWLGTRWLTRWDKEVDLLVKLCYYGLTTGRARQTLGEEYTDIWQYSPEGMHLPPPTSRRLAFIFFLFPAYALGRYGQSHTLNSRYPNVAWLFKQLPIFMEVVTELNLAVFYLRGTYYNLLKRIFRIQYASSIPQNPQVRPPSYSLLGIMIGIRLLYRLVVAVRTNTVPPDESQPKNSTHTRSTELFIDDRPVSSIMELTSTDDLPPKPAEEDEGTALDVASIPAELRSSRNCALCLEERTDTASTECGHLFCWNCIFNWGREKAECPLCRQSLLLDKLLPIYNL